MIEQFPIIDHFAITPRARVTWLADLRHQGTVTTTWPEGTADITWDTGWYSTRVPLTQLGPELAPDPATARESINVLQATTPLQSPS